MNSKRVISLVCIVLLVLSLFAGCKQEVSEAEVKGADTNAETANEKATDSQPPEEVVLRMSWWGGDSRHEGTLAAIEYYMELNPHVTIEAEYGGWDGHWEKLITQLSAGTAPDVMQITPAWVIELSNKGDFFVDLSQEELVDTSLIPSKLLEDHCTTPDGKLIGLAAGSNGVCLIVNTEFMDKYGIDYSADWTFERFLEEGKKVKEQNPDAFLLGTDSNIVGGYFIKPYIMQKTGGQFVNNDYEIEFDEAVATEALAYVKSLFDNGIMQPYGEAELFAGKLEQNPLWISGDIGCTVDWVSTATKYQVSENPEAYDAVRFPVMDGAKQTAITTKAAGMFTVNNQSANKEEALKFVNWLVNTQEASLKLGAIRAIPASELAKEALVEADMIPTIVKNGLDSALANAGNPNSSLLNNGELNEIMKLIYEQVIFGQLTPEEGGKQMVEQFNAKLAELKSAN